MLSEPWFSYLKKNANKNPESTDVLALQFAKTKVIQLICARPSYHSFDSSYKTLEDHDWSVTMPECQALSALLSSTADRNLHFLLAKSPGHRKTHSMTGMGHIALSLIYQRSSTLTGRDGSGVVYLVPGFYST